MIKLGPNSISAILGSGAIAVVLGALLLTDPLPFWAGGWSAQDMAVLPLAGYLLLSLGVVVCAASVIRLSMPEKGEVTKLGEVGDLALAFVLTLATMLLMAAAFHAFFTRFFEPGEQPQRLAIILIAGAFGGLVRQIVDERRVTLMRIDFDKGDVLPGSVGEMIIGMGAAAGIFLVLAGTLNFSDGNGTAGAGTRRLIGFALIAGLSGRTILAQLKTVLQKRIDAATEKADKAAEDAELAWKNLEYDRYITAGMRYDGLGEHDSAVTTFDKAIALFPDDPRAYVGKAEVLSGQATSAGVGAVVRVAKLEEAVELTDTALAKKPDYATALFNRACYKALLQKPFSEVEADLNKAFGLQPDMMMEAAQDDDFVTASQAVSGVAPSVDYVAEVTKLVVTVKARTP